MPWGLGEEGGERRGGGDKRGREKGEEDREVGGQESLAGLRAEGAAGGDPGAAGQARVCGTANFRVCVAGVVSTGLFHITPSAPCMKLPEAEPPQRVVLLVGLLSDPAGHTGPNSISPRIP